MNNILKDYVLKKVNPIYSLELVLSKHAISAPYLLKNASSGSASNVIHWDYIYEGQLGNQNTLSWKVVKPNNVKKFTQHSVLLNEFKFLVKKNNFHNLDIEIQSIKGFSCSKSELESFTNIDELLESGLKRHIYISNKVSQIEYESYTVKNYFFYEWDDRLFYQNLTNPLSLAALKYLASMTNTKIYLNLRSLIFSLNAYAVNRLNEQYYTFLINSAEHTDGFFSDFCEVMLELEINFITHRLDSKVHHHSNLLLINKNEVMSDRIAMLFNKYEYQNIGELLNNHLKHQIKVGITN